MRTKIKITFADGGTAIVAFGLRDPAKIGIVLRAWALLRQRDVMQWDRTSEPAEYWYDGRKKRMCRYDDPISHDLLEMLLPLSVAIEWRKKAAEEMQRQGRTASEIARQLKMPIGLAQQSVFDKDSGGGGHNPQ